jgi:pimeloyl-ACP methyl ester carboxylesterase
MPDGRRVFLPGRGTTFVRDVPGPLGAPTVVLLHGLGATTAVNWPGAFGALSQFRVVALDQTGHGRGIRSPRPFRLEDCADDVVRLADVLAIEKIIPVGYSMGGPVALLTRRRHPSRVSGLVLCATSARFADDGGRSSPLGAAMAASLRLTPPVVRRQISAAVLQYAARDLGIPPAFAGEVRGHDPAAIVEATRALGDFDARPWLAELRCPTASIITTRDRLVPPARQLELARATGACVYEVDANHLSAVGDREQFLPALTAACRSVGFPRDIRATG